MTGPTQAARTDRSQAAANGFTAALRIRHVQEAGGSRRAGERHAVDAAADDAADQSLQRLDVIRRHPAIDRNLDHVGTGQAQRVDHVRQRFPVQLHGNPHSGHVEVRHQMLEHLRRRLRLRRPLLAQPRRADRSARLRSAGQHGRLADGRAQVVGEPPGVGCFHPSAEADSRGRDDDVERRREACAGGGKQFGVVGERHDLDRGRIDDGGAAPGQRACRTPHAGARP